MTNEREPLWIPTPDEIASLRRTLEQQDKRIAELEAQLAQTWQPLPDGEYDCQHDSCKITVAGEWLHAYDKLYSVSVEVALIDNIRLCRLVERAEVQPAIPPDVRETLQDALVAWMVEATIDVAENIYPDSYLNRRRDKVDAALAWLDAA